MTGAGAEASTDAGSVTPTGPNVPQTYGVVSVDHVVSDHFTGSCWAAGIAEGHPRVTEMTYFDHTPSVCRLQEQ